jgi:hypothetical protein
MCLTQFIINLYQIIVGRTVKQSPIRHQQIHHLTLVHYTKEEALINKIRNHLFEFRPSEKTQFPHSLIMMMKGRNVYKKSTIQVGSKSKYLLLNLIVRNKISNITCIITAMKWKVNNSKILLSLCKTHNFTLIS